MYEKLLEMSWSVMLDSEYVFMSNTERRVVQINGSEIDESDDSIILIYYNIFTGKPLLLIQHYDERGRAPVLPSIKGYIKERTEGVDDKGESYTEVVYLDEDTYNFQYESTDKQ